MTCNEIPAPASELKAIQIKLSECGFWFKNNPEIEGDIVWFEYDFPGAADIREFENWLRILNEQYFWPKQPTLTDMLNSLTEKVLGLFKNE